MATSRELKVGAFALAGLLAIGLVIFLIGEEKKLFETKVEYQTVFEDVQGLRRGSPVRMGGVGHRPEILDGAGREKDMGGGHEGGAVIHRDVFFSRYAPVWGGPAVP